MVPFVILSIEDEEEYAFMTEIYLRYERLMWAEIHKRHKDPADAEDVFQTCLVGLVRNVQKLRTLEERERINYIITAVQHTASNFARGKRRHPTVSMEEQGEHGPEKAGDEDGVEELLCRREAVAGMESVWPMLDERTRYLLEGKYFLGLSNQEMARELNIGADSVRVELGRARKRVRRLMEKLDLQPEE